MQHDVEFRSGADEVRGTLYLPDGPGPHPLVVMAGGWCYVKELIQPQYAAHFVAAGMAALIFDYRRLGASSGVPRQHLDPWDQIEDYRNAISYAQTLPSIDPAAIGVWGISYSGGHALILAAIEPRIRCAVSTIPVVDGYTNMRRVHGGLGFRRLCDALAEDRRTRFETGEFGYLPMSGPDPANELVTWPFPEVTPVFEGFKDTVAPRHEHRSTFASVELLLNYSVFPFLPRILHTPVLVVVAEGDDITLWDKEIEAYRQLPTQRKKLVVIDETSHMTLYSNKSRLEIAALEAADWFTEHLKGPPSM